MRWALEPAPGPRVLDLRAGTGKLTATLVALGADVTAVEPDPAMRSRVAPAAARSPRNGRQRRGHPAAGCLHRRRWWLARHCIGSTWPWLAQKWRASWFPAALLAGLWNVNDDRVDWVAELERISEGSASLTFTDWNAHSADIRLASMDLPGLFSPPDRAEFPHQLRRTAESLLATIATHSRLLVMDDEERTALLGRISDYLASLPETSAGEFTLPLLTGVLRARRD